MKGAYKHTAKAGFIKTCLRFIEDPNRNLFLRLFMALSPLFILYVISPLDLAPEALLGPLGLADDGAVLIALFFIYRLAYSFYKTKEYTKKIN